MRLLEVIRVNHTEEQQAGTQKASLRSHRRLAGGDTGERHSSCLTMDKGVGIQMPPTLRRFFDSS